MGGTNNATGVQASYVDDIQITPTSTAMGEGRAYGSSVSGVGGGGNLVSEIAGGFIGLAAMGLLVFGIAKLAGVLK